MQYWRVFNYLSYSFVHLPKNFFSGKLVFELNLFFPVFFPSMPLATAVPNFALSVSDVISSSNCLLQEVVFKTDQPDLKQPVSFSIYFFLSLYFSSLASSFGVSCRFTAHNSHRNHSCSQFGNVLQHFTAFCLTCVSEENRATRSAATSPLLNICMARSDRHTQVRVLLILNLNQIKRTSAKQRRHRVFLLGLGHNTGTTQFSCLGLSANRS